ncbi:MAG: tetratricopeptide repeat protein, partial [Candidatus Caenarcaniphilales bacterium]|nr:tetratricopeptide repeat protein [Candidatus Caenarcaniphilales bacterium]
MTGQISKQAEESFGKQDYKQAIVHYTKVIEANPKPESKLSEAYLKRGISYLKTEKFEEALKDFDKAIELTPNLEQAYNQRGLAKANLGKQEEAIKDFDKAIEINPK